MVKLFVEADCRLNAKFLKSTGFVKKKRIFSEKNWEKFTEKEKQNSVVLISDDSIISRIYQFPKLKKKELELALEQKLRRDLEFISPLETLSWTYSFNYVGKSIVVIASLIETEKIDPFTEAKAVTLSPILIFNALNGKTRKTFILAHSFKGKLTTFVFLNGILDYIKAYPEDTQPAEAIELTKEFYKEHKKVEASEIYISGDWEEIPNNYKKISELIKIRDTKYAICQLAETTKVPFLLEKESHTKEISLFLIPLFITAGNIYTYTKLNTMTNKLKELQSQITVLKEKVTELNNRKQNLENDLRIIEDKLHRKDINNLVSTERYCIKEFLQETEKILKSTNSYIVSLEKKQQTFMVKFATLCKDINSPEEYRKFVKEFKNIHSAQIVNLIDSRKLKDTNVIISQWKIKLQRKPYVEIKTD